MNETSYVPKSLSPEPKPISPEVLEKFSKGDLQLDQHMLIKGEGKDRKLHISVAADNPLYIVYQEARESSLKIAEKLHKIGHVNDRVMNDALDMINEFKKGFKLGAQKIHIGRFIENKRNDFSRRSKEVPNDISKQNLASEVGEFNNLIDYIKYLVGQNAVQIILPEQKPPVKP
ncbi:MAG: hypothetical protein A3D74_01165 [Candidatus Levybacteria bacterium RIFCSPHIGHO2_02_FULL_37_13]|nr:MAG: hypothetical protein A3D74_01165 [Candidatus Levybacteria bacterium RIFCSPHIGHO2_02_FULL_37_13]OGH30411.1 MAG: hypothetical protein A3E40_01320 [Candidatus Levybacteria bacterium RIFCSPHIGHO2_12_FULL_37_9]OGH39626.1 MAG: hypothetical protein A3B41_01750 [Candidatus Levybacteria bacterium RIFCSPLOWO2_01_FULL_37_26]